MPSFANESDKILARVIEHWKRTAFDEVDGIGGWRDADPSDRSQIYWSERKFDRGTVHKETMPGMFFGDTTHLVGRIENDYRHLDPAPLMELYEAIAAWHADKTAERIPPQPVLFSTLERAMMTVLVVETDLQSRLRALPEENEAADRASGRNAAATIDTRSPAPDIRRQPNATEQAVIDLLHKRGFIGQDALVKIPLDKRPTAERLAYPAIGRDCDGQFKGTLSHMIDLGWLDNGTHHAAGPGYYLTAEGAALATHRRQSGPSQD